MPPTAATSATAAEGLDGRQSRTARSRRAICEACLDLVEEGVLQPSAEEVAKRAGVSRRSIFNHFADLAELYDAVVEVGRQRCEPLLEEISTALPLSRRIEEFVRVRSNFLEATSASTLALTAQSLVGPESEQALRVSREGLRLHHREVERLFGPELGVLDATEKGEVLEAISVALAPLSWEYLRRSRRNSVARARTVSERTIRALLRGAGVAV